MPAVIEAKQLSKHFQQFCALEQVSFTLEAGQTLALLGHNGAGKSTLIKLILGLIPASSGELTVLGRSAHSVQNRHQIGYLPENVSFYEQMTGKELLGYFAKLKQQDPQQAVELLAEYGLTEAADKQLKHYSKGMRQRIGLAQATLGKPQLILLDEPTVGLDPLASAFMYQKIRQLKQQGCAIVICTHELALVEAEFDHALFMAKGKVLAQGSFAELQQQVAAEALTQIFHKLMQPYAQVTELDEGR